MAALEKKIGAHLRAAHDAADAKVKIQILDPERGTPWRYLATVTRLGRMPYDRLGHAFYRMETDDSLTGAIGARRMSRIVVVYSGPQSPGSDLRVEREWTVGRIAPWEVTISTAAAEYDGEVEDAIPNRYGMFGDELEQQPYAKSILVWLSSEEARARKVATRSRRRND